VVPFAHDKIYNDGKLADLQTGEFIRKLLVNLAAWTRR
jgi:hypothetical protein